MGEHRHPQLPRGVHLLAVDRGPTGCHPPLQLLQGHLNRRLVRPLEVSPILGGGERQQRRDRLGRAEVAVDPGHVEPARGHPLTGDWVCPGGVGGLDQPLAGQGMAAGGQPLEPHPVQPLQAEACP